MFTEKRKYKRLDIPTILKFRTKPFKDREEVLAGWDMVAVNDLGSRGVFFNSSKHLEVGTDLDLKIGFATTTSPIRCSGIVTRVKKTPDTSIFGIVAMFTEIAEQEKNLINKAVEETVR